MATPSEITPLIEQAWNTDPEQNFFEFLYDVFQTNETLFSLGGTTHDEVKTALDTYIASGGNSAEEATPEASVEGASAGDTTGNPVS